MSLWDVCDESAVTEGLLFASCFGGSIWSSLLICQLLPIYIGEAVALRLTPLPAGDSDFSAALEEYSL